VAVLLVVVKVGGLVIEGVDVRLEVAGIVVVAVSTTVVVADVLVVLTELEALPHNPTYEASSNTTIRPFSHEADRRV